MYSVSNKRFLGKMREERLTEDVMVILFFLSFFFWRNAAQIVNIEFLYVTGTDLSSRVIFRFWALSFHEIKV